MANCNEYAKLSSDDQLIMIGKITHLIQNDSFTFREVEYLISIGERLGKLQNVKILQPRQLAAIQEKEILEILNPPKNDDKNNV